MGKLKARKGRPAVVDSGGMWLQEDHVAGRALMSIGVDCNTKSEHIMDKTSGI